ncbi:MAG: ABC transporter ATP-binding protein [Cenarchaeum sp. SB0665_bin_23]|nr:ABC transporter ATP-binding protein [Cenarchaeum sp. SB0667_bin_13]MXY37472.1 ABC transporter ATP-binding protein [Cenarchaeum sp. SB0664_bin_35]MXY61366.1 ABC transporter ATP-binding protein [Cenarchaeum sp. SB0665_bin_23]MXZ93304.1 ABC transporter ATP-binding protein [Cenarchaeum sp. SB0666_bin_15]MYB47168.1 ABC transporter ATP-binding protein [Cenarchaeum sp. SB0662_bin_33]MYC78957.1 ABC transporter ATP-binding protein [Cenarchaeum sp. SB0661_bin_35]MYD58863.1 ABC transporter ATP-bindin
MSKVLDIRNLYKIYGKEKVNQVTALDDVSFSIDQGEFALIVGSSGSGKSTLLNIIGLLDKPTNGTVRVAGTDTSKLNDGQISSFRNKKVGFVFQFSNLLSDLTVLENVMLPMQMAGMQKSREKATELLMAVGLKDQMKQRADRISGGQAQRAAIARGLANQPALVLADEPTGNLDSVTSKNVVKLMKSMCETLGQTFVVVTHDQEDFGNVDHIIQMRDGKAFETSMVRRVAT